jgi:hypothetical protein
MRVKGTLIVLVVLSVLLVLSGCDTGGGGGGQLYVVAGVETDDGGNTTVLVIVSEGGLLGTWLDDATVKVNNETINWFGIGYIGTLTTSVSAGGNVTLDIQRGGASINATLQMPEKPVITAPAAGPDAEPVDVAWTSTSNPDEFTIYVADTYTDSGIEYEDYETGSSRSHQIPTGTFDTTLVEAYVEVSAGTQTTSLGADAESGSVFGVENTDRSSAFDPQ